MTLGLLWIEVLLVFVLAHFGRCDDTGELVMANVVSESHIHYLFILCYVTNF